MNITLWGTRGSVPVSGASFLRHGGCTTCVSIELDAPLTRRGEAPPFIIIDAGTGLAELGKNSVGPWNNCLLLQTHLHWDHVQGFPFFGPLFNPASKFDLWSVERDGESVNHVLDRQMSRPTFPVGLDILPSRLDFRSIPADGATSVGGVEIRWTEMSHPSGSTAYRIDYAGRAFVFSGDVEVQHGDSRDALIELATGADLLVMDAQYFPDEYVNRVDWGHSTPADVVDVALAAGVGRVVMTHHDPSHDDARLEQKLQLARGLARGTSLVVDNAYDRMTVELGDHDTRAAA